MENTLKTDTFYQEMSSLISPLGLSVIETRVHRLQNGASIAVYVTKQDDVNSDDLENVYNLVYLKLKSRFNNLTLEISTPGLTRNIKDAGEFAFFIEKSVRIYSLQQNAWLRGIISNADDKSVTLNDCIIEDAPENSENSFETKTILFSDIKKARLIDAVIKEKN